MSNNFNKVKEYLTSLGFTLVSEDETQQTLVVSNDTLNNVVLYIDNETLVLKTPVTHLSEQASTEAYKQLLLMNDTFTHGALALSDNGRVDFKDTFHLATLDLAELESSLDSLTLFLAENLNELIEITKLQEPIAL